MHTLQINDEVIEQYKKHCFKSAQKDEPISYKIQRMVDLGGELSSSGNSKVIRYFYINLLIEDDKVVQLWKDKDIPANVVSEEEKNKHKKYYFDSQNKEETNMIYNKAISYENKGIHKRRVSIDDNLNVKTNAIPKQLIPLLAKELSESLPVEHEYKRVNPFRFDTTTDRHVYIEYAEENHDKYTLHKKMIIRKSHKGNIKIPAGTFLYDVLDYFVYINLLDEDYKFIGKINKSTMNAKVLPIVDKYYLESKGFIFPENETA